MTTRHRLLERAVAVALLALGTTLAAPARAAPTKGGPTPGEKLFREGREAMDRKELAVACAKFADSYALEGVVTSLLNEADCEEKRGRLATSLRLWQDGRTKADDASTRAFVDGRVAALSPRVPKLVVHAGPGSGGASVTIDGVALTLDAPLAVDPGDHVIEARSKGGVGDTRRILVDEGKSVEVTVLAEPATLATDGASSEHEDATSRGRARPNRSARLRTAGWVVGAVGVAGLATFGVTGAMVLADHEDCPDFRCSSDKRPQALLGVNGVALGVGVLGVGVAIPLLVVGYGQKSSPVVALEPMIGGAGLRGVF